MKPIHLDLPQRQELERPRRQTHDKRIFERISAVLWAADGMTRFEIAEQRTPAHIVERPTTIQAAGCC